MFSKMNELLIQVYTTILPEIRDAGKELGWAIAVHGSLVRDFDLIAVKWTEDARPQKELIDKLLELLKPYDREGVSKRSVYKGNGRTAYDIPIGCGMYIDLSVVDCEVQNA